MPNVAPSRTDGSSEPSAAPPELRHPRSALPLGFGPSPTVDRSLPIEHVDGATTTGASHATLGAPSPADAGPRPLSERDHELIDFLVRRAIEKCTPSPPEPSLSAFGARQRSAKKA